MSNIFDKFNERKYGYVSESYDESDCQYNFESLDEAMEAMNDIMEESTNGMIELKGAFYLEDLVLENMMLDDFDADVIEESIKETVKGRASKLVAKVKALWKKFKDWFIATIKAIGNYFVSGEKLVKANAGKIPGAIKDCKRMVKTYDYKPHQDAKNQVNEMLERVRGFGGSSLDKEEFFKKLGVADKKEIIGKVKECYTGTAKPREMYINELNAEVLMAYAGKKKDIIDDFNKFRTTVDNAFKEVMSNLNKAEFDISDTTGKENHTKIVDVFTYACSLKSVILNAALGCIKKASSDSLSIIRKALGAASGAGLQPVRDKLAKEAYEFDDIDFL